MLFFRNKENKIFSWLLIIVVVFFISVLALISTYLIFEKKYENRFYLGVSVGDIELTGLTYDEALTILEIRIEDLMQNGVSFSFTPENGSEKKIQITPIISSLGSDLSYQIIFFNPRDTLNEAIAIGRSHELLDDLKSKIELLRGKKKLDFRYRLNDDEALKILQDNFREFEKPSVDADIIVNQANGKFIFDLSDEQSGKIFDYSIAIRALNDRLQNLDATTVYLYTVDDFPKIKKSDITGIDQKAQAVLDLAPLKLSYDAKDWTIQIARLSEWLRLEKNNEDEIIVDLNQDKIAEYLEKTVSPSINRYPVPARFEVNQGRVTSFQIGKNGVSLDLQENASLIRDNLIQKKSSETTLVSSIIENEITDDKVNSSGIKEIIGTGHSNFSGSPSNRRHNIRTGAAAINGLLIKPDEEFSLVQALGSIDASTGYLTELVIKGNETIPEFGGGLCQIGTTMFRTVYASGLPITQRRNHSYRVSYYEPAGTDATIYSPWPDMRFYNDTGNYILIQTRFMGENDLYFDFWGTSDGRKASSTYPTIYNIKKPEPTKFIETDKLAPGEKKCTEHSHNGADAWFDYRVSYPENFSPTEEQKKTLELSFDKVEVNNGVTVASKRFYSHYIPWREVCLVGIENATSTEEIVEETIDQTIE